MLAAHGVLVARLSADVVLLREVLGGDAHGRAREGVREPAPERVLELRRLPQRHAPPRCVSVHGERRRAHVLGAAAEGDLGLAQQDGLRA